MNTSCPNKVGRAVLSAPPSAERAHQIGGLLNIRGALRTARPTSWAGSSSAVILALLLLSIGSSAMAAGFSEWQYRQSLPVSDSGVIKLSLPVETLDRAQAGLEDLRILDPAGEEVPYALERPHSSGKTTRAPRTFNVSLNGQSTVISMETGLRLPLEAVTLETPASSFIKAVQLEGSTNQQQWQVLATGQPIFRQGGVTQLRLPLTGVWPFLRLTVDDQRSEAIPFTGAMLLSAAEFTAPQESLDVSIAERVENPGQTRLALNLGAANLDVVSVRFETPEPLFTRRVRFAVRQVSENSLREQVIGEGVIYRVELPGQPASANLSLALDRLVPSRELIVLIQNDDSPPLRITSVSAQRRPVYAIFVARQSGTFTLLTGNKRASLPRYDLSALGASLRNVPVSPLHPGTLASNPDYRPPESLPEVTDSGATLDVAAWRFRKPLKPERAGVQQVELDADVLAHARPDFADLRFLREGRQVPYILEHTSITRPLAVTATLANGPKRPTVTRWALQLSHPRLPVDRLVCNTDTPLFKRDFRLYEMLADDRGREYEHDLGQATWVQTPEQKSKHFTLQLSDRPQSAQLYLETYNGDNPPVTLSNFQLYYPVTRLLFKSTAAPLHLYYGHREVAAPSYDLSLVAAQVLAAEKAAVALGPEEQLKKGGWSEKAPAGTGTAVFWGILALVVVGLLLLIARLLPKTEPTGKKSG